MNGLDAVIFTAGVGENDAVMRELVCSNMEFLRISLDQERNQLKAKDVLEINTKASEIKILVIPTNEELEIAIQSYKIGSV